MSNMVVRWRRVTTDLRVFAFGALVFGACGEAVQESTEEVGSQEEALQCAANPSDPNCTWKVFSRLLPSGGVASDIVHEQAPAICGNSGAALVFSVDTSHRYRSLGLNAGANSSSWGVYSTPGSFNSFASKPACTMRETGASGRSGIVVAGKGTDGKIYASAGLAGLPSSPQALPVPGTFTAVNSTVYNNSPTNVAGQPAMATGGFTTQKVVMVFMGDDGRTIYAHTRALPYVSNTWSTRKTGPTLPTGWTAMGVPSIVAHPVTFYIVVHARNGTSDRLFVTHFNGDDNGFSNGIGSPATEWVLPAGGPSALPNLGTIEISPALAYSPDHGHGTTVYFLRSGQIMQTTMVSQWGDRPIHPVRPASGFTIASSPSASDGWGFDSQGGTHHVVARTSGNYIVYGLTNMNTNVIP